MAQLIFYFLILAALIVVAGFFLTRFAGELADRMGIGQTMGGFLLLAMATSLPELVVAVRAVLEPAINLAIGSTIGSSLFNLLILACLDLGRRGSTRILSPTAAAHSLSAVASIVLTAIAGLFIVLPFNLQIAHCGLGTLLIGVAYVLFVRLIFFDQQFAAMRDEAEADLLPEEPLVKPRVSRLVLGYLVATFVVFAAATMLVPVADELAVVSGLGRTFVGTAFVALASSLPEIVTTLSAIKMGAEAMAVGNILGSNAFNITILLPADLFYRGNLLADASPTHVVTAFCVVIVTAVSTAGLLYQPDRTRGLEPDAKAVIALVAGAFLLVYLAG